MIMEFSSSDESDLEMLQQLSDWDRDDDDTEIQTRTSKRTYTRVNYMSTLNDYDFTFRFRLNKTVVTELVELIRPSLKTQSSRNYGVSALHQTLLTLRYYALGGLLSPIAEYIGVSRSSASRIVSDVSRAIANLYDVYVILDTNTEQEFFKIASFPKVHGVIDCTQVMIQPSNLHSDEEHRTNKGTLPFNIQIVCDARLRFQSVLPHWPGSTPKEIVFNKSTLRDACEKGKLSNRWLLGDSDYPSKSYLLTPILYPSTPPERLYNEAHRKTHSVAESCIALWKRRFPVLSSKMRLTLPTIENVVLATSVLHNIARKMNLPDIEPEINGSDQDISNSGFSTHERDALVNNYFGKIYKARNDLIKDYFSGL